MIRLGSKVRDRVSGAVGIATGETRWLTGCLRYVIEQAVGADGKMPDPLSADEHRLEVLELPEVTGIHAIGASLQIETETPRPPTTAPGGPYPTPSQY